VGPRDVSLVAFRLLALWVMVSGVQATVELALTWPLAAAPAMAGMDGVANAPTEGELRWMTFSALVARVGVGLVLWWVAPLLAGRLQPAAVEGVAQHADARSLYGAGAFLVGVWLLGEAIPGLGFLALAASRPGVPAYDDGGGAARVAEYLLKLICGVAFVRGGWLVSAVLGGPTGTDDEQ
jgi:hypothetical protein